MADYTYSNEVENRFWLQILGDLAIFLHQHIPEGQSEASDAMDYFTQLESLYKRALMDLDAQSLAQLNKDAYEEVSNFRTFVLDILRKMLQEGFFVSLKIYGINTMVNLAERYLYELYHFINHKQLTIDPVEAELFWLPVMKEEARYISDQLGYFRENLQMNSEYFMRSFGRFFESARLLKDLSRTGTTDFELTKQYRDELYDSLNNFANYLGSLVQLQQKNLLPGTMSLLELDFAQRILCYYFILESYVAGKEVPSCNFFSKRLSTL
jgi:hypothetical protein